MAAPFRSSTLKSFLLLSCATFMIESASLESPSITTLSPIESPPDVTLNILPVKLSSLIIETGAVLLEASIFSLSFEISMVPSIFITAFSSFLSKSNAAPMVLTASSLVFPKPASLPSLGSTYAIFSGTGTYGLPLSASSTASTTLCPSGFTTLSGSTSVLC